MVPGCVKRAPTDRGDQDAGITQPRDNLYPIPVEWKTLLASISGGSPRTHLTPRAGLSSSSDTLVIVRQIFGIGWKMQNVVAFANIPLILRRFFLANPRKRLHNPSKLLSFPSSSLLIPGPPTAISPLKRV